MLAPDKLPKQPQATAVCPNDSFLSIFKRKGRERERESERERERLMSEDFGVRTMWVGR